MKKRNAIATFHSAVKYKILNDIIRCKLQTFTILDMCIGRGGDIFKYTNLISKVKKNIDIIYGIDVDNNALNECQNRWDAGAECSMVPRPTLHLDQCDMVNTRFVEIIKKKTDRKFNLIVCNFAIHYFMKSKKVLEKIFDQIQELADKECIVWFTFPDGDKLIELTKKYKSNEIRTDRYILQIPRIPKKSSYGVICHYRLFGTIYFDDFLTNSTSNEFLTFVDIIKKMSEKYRMKLKRQSHFDEFASLSTTMTDVEKEISFANVSTIFLI